MIPALALACFLQAPAPNESAASRSLRYLARHQRPDGSWGGRPAGCTCPNETGKVPACEAARVAPFLAALRDEDPEKRDSAERELRLIGEPALPHLQAALRDPDPEVRGRCAVLCRGPELGTQGGGDAELTGLALLVFLGAGYCHLSKDEVDGISYGTVVKKGIQWLVARQKETGAFDAEDPAGDAVATMALSESFGMTASPSQRDDAQKAIDRLVATPMETTRGLLWKGMALKSAELGELNVPRIAYDSVESIREKRGDLAIAGTTVLSLFIRKNRADPRLAELLLLDPALLESESLYAGTLAAFQLDGPSGPVWNRWNASLKVRLVPSQRSKEGECERGSWDGRSFRARLLTTALNAMDFEFYRR